MCVCVCILIFIITFSFQASVGISLVSESVKNNVFECSFLRKKSVADIDKIFDIGRPWHVLFTRGVAYAGIKFIYF